MLGMKGLTRSDPRRFALGVLNTALGGGTSSRLFQEVRERRGLAYAVYSFSSAHADAGLVGVAVGCLPNKLDAVLDDGARRARRDRPRRHHRRRARARSGPAAPRPGARDGGLRLADDPAGQGRDRLRRAARPRRGASTASTPSPSRTSARSRASSSPSPRSWPSSAPPDRPTDALQPTIVRLERIEPSRACSRSPDAQRTIRGRGRTYRRPIKPTTGGAFCSTTDTRKPPSVRAAEVLRTMVGTSSGRLAS